MRFTYLERQSFTKNFFSSVTMFKRTAPLFLSRKRKSAFVLFKITSLNASYVPEYS